MIIMLPISSPQTISIIPRDTSIASATLCLKRDGDGAKFTETVTLSDSGNYRNLTFSCDILKEGETYFLELTEADKLIYRDKVFSTAKSDFKVKHKTVSDSYKQGVTDDNTYII